MSNSGSLTADDLDVGNCEAASLHSLKLSVKIRFLGIWRLGKHLKPFLWVLRGVSSTLIP